MDEGEIYFAFVLFDNPRHGKSRPVVVEDYNDSTIRCYAITTKYKYKSNAEKAVRCHLDDWPLEGLTKDSWVCIDRMADFLRGAVSIRYIGELTHHDVQGIIQFRKDYNKAHPDNPIHFEPLPRSNN